MPAQKPWAHLDPDSNRAETWRAIYGGLSVPIESPCPVLAHSPIGIEEFYKLDLDRLEPEVIERAIGHIVERFELPEAEVREGVFGEQGLPILAEDVFVECDPRSI